jgi:hypothetical protein
VLRGTTAFLTVPLFLGVIGTTRTALADPIPTTSLSFNMQGTVCAPSCGVPLNVVYDFSTNNGPTSDPLEVLLGGAGNGALVSGIADFGHLGVLAQADTQAMNTGASGSMLGVARASFTEPFMVTSSTLAPGTTVKAMAVLSMDGIADVSGGSVIPGSATDAAWSFNAWMQNLSNPSDYAIVCADSSAPECLLGPNIPFETTKSFVFTFTVGDVDVIEGSMLASASAGSATVEDLAFASSTVTSSAFHTAKFYLDPLDDFTLVSFSGHDYSLSVSAVPEPGSVLLVAGGLSTLLVVRRRRGSRR